MNPLLGSIIAFLGGAGILWGLLFAASIMGEPNATPVALADAPSATTSDPRADLRKAIAELTATLAVTEARIAEMNAAAAALSATLRGLQ